MKNLLNRANKLVELLNTTTSTNDKIGFLKEYLTHDSELSKLFMYVHNPFYQFFITSSVCIKNKDLEGKEFDSIFTLLDALRNRSITGHTAIGVVNSFIKKYPEFGELIYNIIDKDLKSRVGDSAINKAIPGLIPVFDVALAEKFEPEIVNFEKEEWYVSRKLDGVRCLVVVDNEGKVTSFSRQGKIFETLNKVEETISKLNLRGIVFDGEICMIDKDGKEEFQSIMKEIRKKNHTIENVQYKMFDCLSLEEFANQRSLRKLSVRLSQLDGIYLTLFTILKDKTPQLIKVCDVLPQEKIHDIKHFQKWLDMSGKEGWEGVMLRKNVGYKGKRSKDLLKAKKFHDAEYIVEGITYGPIRMIVDGKEITETMTSQVMIKHKGFEVGVGSGFSLEQRIEFYKDPSKIVGKTINVQYFEETKNQEGGISLRFPVLKHVYENERNT